MADYQYITKSPERWDNVAFKAYGDPNMVEVLVKANPNVLITPIIPAGTLLVVPVISDDNIPVSKDLLPPWFNE